MPKEKNSPQYFKSSRIEEVNYKRQGKDLFHRFKQELGRIITGQGFPAYTNFQIYCDTPTLQHPDFHVKIMLSNKAGGSVFTQISITEFDQLISDIIDWRQKYDHEIKIGLNSSMELRKRKHLHTTIGNILTDENIPTAIAEKIIEESIPDVSPSSTETITPFSFEKLGSIFLENWTLYSSEQNPIKKKYHRGICLALIPSDLTSQDKFFQLLLHEGLHPETIYNELSTPIDKDLSFLYNKSISPNNSEENKECLDDAEIQESS